MLACISIIIIFTTIILTKSVQYQLSRWHVTTNSLPEHLTSKHTKMNHYQTKHKVQHKRLQSCTSTLPSVQITMLATSTDQCQQPNFFSVDTDGVYFIINNSAKSGICNIKSMFVGNFERHRVTIVTAYERTTTKKLVGTIRLILKDDKNLGHMTFLMLSMIQNHHIRTPWSESLSLNIE